MDHDRVDSYIYHYLGMERNEEMVSDNAHDRYCGAWRAYEAGQLKVPSDWRTPAGWDRHASGNSSGGPTRFQDLELPAQIALAAVLFVLAGAAAASVYWLLTG